MAIEELGKKPQTLNRRQILERHQKVVVVERELIAERSRTHIVAPPALFANVNQMGLGLVPNLIARFTNPQAKIGLFANGAALKPLIKEDLMLGKNFATKRHVAAARGQHGLGFDRVHKVEVVPGDRRIHGLGRQILDDALGLGLTPTAASRRLGLTGSLAGILGDILGGIFGVFALGIGELHAIEYPPAYRTDFGAIDIDLHMGLNIVLGQANIIVNKDEDVALGSAHRIVAGTGQARPVELVELNLALGGKLVEKLLEPGLVTGFLIHNDHLEAGIVQL